MKPTLYPIPGPWVGQLAIAARPRGGEWLADEIDGLRRAGVEVVVSFLTNDEQLELELAEEADVCRAVGIDFVNHPIEDRGVPETMESFAELILLLSDRLNAGKSVALHCRLGLGRAALAAIALVVQAGVDLDAATASVAAARGCPVPETPQQRQFLRQFAQSVAASLVK
jgi:protein-tyrosine phosphatase